MKEPKFVDAAGVNTRYFEAGSGEPIVLVHGGQFGFYSSALDWSTVFDLLARDFHVYALDKIGQGYTDNPKHESDYVMETTVWHLRAFLAAVGIQAAHLAGHSRGGYTIARLALEDPELAKSLIIVDSGTLMDKSRGWYNRVASEAEACEDEKEAIKYLIAANSYGVGHVTEEWLADLLSIGAFPSFRRPCRDGPILNRGSSTTTRKG